MNGLEGSRGISLGIRDLIFKGRWTISFRFRLLVPRKQCLRYPFDPKRINYEGNESERDKENEYDQFCISVIAIRKVVYCTATSLT